MARERDRLTAGKGATQIPSRESIKSSRLLHNIWRGDAFTVHPQEEHGAQQRPDIWAAAAARVMAGPCVFPVRPVAPRGQLV